MIKKLDEHFIKSLVVIARGIVGTKMDPEEIVNGAVEYIITNREKYMNHPNIKAIAVLKMKGLFIDEIRKNKKITSMTDNEGNDLQIIDEKQTEISEKINLSNECQKVLSIINDMGGKCREILMLAADDLSYKEIAKNIETPIGTVMSRLANCRKELKGLIAK